MSPSTRTPGRTQDFVAARGFERLKDRTVLLDGEGRGRLFLELTMDADHPRSDPAAAYERLLSTLEPGAQMRILQIFWPDAGPREDFIRQSMDWPPGGNEFKAGLAADLTGFLAEAPLPYLRRTILEIVVLNDAMLDWIGGAVEILRSAGINARPLEPFEVQALARWVFNPELA